MKTQTENVQRWDDIIFENRNKDYGAYAIRKDYKTRVLKAEAIGIGILALIFVTPILMHEDTILPDLPKPDPGLVIRVIDGTIKPKITPPPAPRHARRVDAEVVPIKPTTKDVPDSPTEPPKQGVSYTNPPEDGTPGSEDDPEDSEGTGSTPAVIEPPKVWDFVEKMPEYDGGYEAMMKFVQKKMRYPSIAVRKGDEGTVYVQFVINPDGTVTDVKVVKGIGKECDQEAVRVISMMNKWKPGIQNNHPVSVRTTIPITFRLER